MIGSEYPETVIEVLDDALVFSDELLRVVAKFASSRPWRGSRPVRQSKFFHLNHDLARACRIREPTLEFEALGEGDSVMSFYSGREHKILMVGKLSVVTYLHEFAHAWGYNEREACRWSINLFRKCFPREYSKLIHIGHTLVHPTEIAEKINRRYGIKSTRTNEVPT